MLKGAHFIVAEAPSVMMALCVCVCACVYQRKVLLKRNSKHLHLNIPDKCFQNFFLQMVLADNEKLIQGLHATAM